MVSRKTKKISWLQDLGEGTSPLLSRREQELVEDIFYEAESEFRYVTSPSYEGTDDMLQKIQILEENLQLIIQRFKFYQEARNDFIDNYPSWERVRLRSIRALQAIGSTIHTCRRNCNITRLVGNSISLVGGGLLVASAALTPFTLGLSTPVAVVGGIATGSGSLTSVVTSVTEIVLLNKKVEKAKAIIEEDKESFKALKLWLTHANDVTEALNAVLNTESDKNVVEVVETIRSFMNLALEVKNTVLRSRTIETLIATAKQILPQEFGRARVIANLVGLLAVIALLNNKNPEIFEDVSKTMTIVTTSLSLLDISASLIQPFVKTDAAVLQNIGKNIGQISATAVARGAVALIGMSLDIASIVLASIDLHKGSLSEEENKIMKAANKMKEETEILDKIWFELISSN